MAKRKGWVRIKIACAVADDGQVVGVAGQLDKDGNLFGYTSAKKLLEHWSMLDWVEDQEVRYCWMDGMVPLPDPGDRIFGEAVVCEE